MKISDALVVLLLGLAGCHGLAPAQEALDPSGPVSLRNGDNTGQFRIFEISYKRAWDDQVLISNGEAAANAPAHARQMAIDGISLADANCKKFFDTAGENQTDILFGRDVVGAAGTLATGVIALAAHGNAATAAVVGLTSATLYSGIDIYTKNFLFGSDNIEHVRTLIANALAEHTKAAFASPAPWTFGDAVDAIQDHQNICRPAHIRALVLDAIQSGHVVATTPETPTNTQPPRLGVAPPPPPPPPPPLRDAPPSGGRHITVQIAK